MQESHINDNEQNIAGGVRMPELLEITEVPAVLFYVANMTVWDRVTDYGKKIATDDRDLFEVSMQMKNNENMS